MKSILIPVETHTGMSAVLDRRLLAQKFDSYIEGVALEPGLTQIVAADFSLDGIVFDDAVRRDLLDEARKTSRASCGMRRSRRNPTQLTLPRRPTAGSVAG